ncbi:MAG: HAD-IB family phosphatase [Clostridiales bacterium]|nr:HAD-IB family phosphatase [Clostridiales bacterium]
MNVYDFDNTVIRGDSSFLFYVWCLRRHPKILQRLPGVAWYAFKYLKKDKQRFKQHMFGYLNDLADPEKELSAFWDRHMSRVKAYYLRRKRADDVIISASPEFLVAHAMARLGVNSVIASPVDERTGMYSGLNCHGEEKVRRFREEYPEAAINEFCSDSLSDSPLARLAEKAFLVKGEKLLPWPEK